MATTTTPEERAHRRARHLTDLLWHAAAFVIINAGFLLMDLFLGQSGLQWSLWITAFWGFALAFHVATYLIAGREDIRYMRFLAEEQRQHPLPH